MLKSLFKIDIHRDLSETIKFPKLETVYNCVKKIIKKLLGRKLFYCGHAMYAKLSPIQCRYALYSQVECYSTVATACTPSYLPYNAGTRCIVRSTVILLWLRHVRQVISHTMPVRVVPRTYAGVCRCALFQEPMQTQYSMKMTF